MKTTQTYRSWIAFLAVLVAAGTWCYLRQLDSGLGLTGMSRDVTWGLYVGQFIFAEGIAASAFLVVQDRSLALFGSMIGIAGVIASMLFIVADMGQPSRVLNVLLYASPGSLMFWDMLSLSGYLTLNIVIAAVLLGCERTKLPPPRWLRPVIQLSIPWAIGMLTIGAFLYCGLPGRSYWLTAILAPRFIVSACASGSALLVLMLLVLRLRVADDTLHRLATIVRYAVALNIFFVLLEVFTAFYSQVPEPMEHFHAVGPWLWISMILAVASLHLRRKLALASALALASLWIDKGFGMVIGGFSPSPLGAVADYMPTAPEIAIAAGIWAAGALVATLLYAAGNSELLLLKQEVSH